jgi:membrane protein
MKKILLSIKTGVKIFLRRLFITMQFSGENSLPNHAAACAYGFLLSAAPLLLIISFFIFRAFQVSTSSIISLAKNLPFMEIAIDDQWLTDNFYSIMLPGLSGVTALISFLWAGRILAVSLQRGLKIIFSGQKKRNPIFATLVILAVELPALFLSLTIIFSSKTAVLIYETFNFLPKNALFSFLISKHGYSFFSKIILGLITYFAYRVIPANPPRRISALEGAVFCVILYEIMSMILKFMFGQSMYNILYGTLGNLIALLINVYFFFMLFLMGGQFAYVSEYFDSFLFIKMRQARLNRVQNNRSKFYSVSNLINSLFLPVEGRLRKYYRCHKKGETIFFSERQERLNLLYTRGRS